MSKSQRKGQRRVRITPELIEDWLIHGYAIETDLPKNARLLDHWVNDEYWEYIFLFESKEWEPMSEGELIPDIKLKIKEVES